MAKRLYEVDRDARRERRRVPVTAKKVSRLIGEGGEVTEIKCDVVTTPEEAELRGFVASLASSYAASVEFYKTEYGGQLTHAEAVEAEAKSAEWRREHVVGKNLKDVSWSDLSALAGADIEEAVGLWARIRDAADEALMCGTRAATVAGALSPYERAEYLAIRDAFADQWKPQGGIESAMIDQLTAAFSQQMYWTAIAHARATGIHDEQRQALRRYETSGWKSPYQSAADAIEQAYRLADGFNRQFLRVLRQMRDLRRYAPPVIINNGGQVNVASSGGQQVNVAK